MEFLIYCEFIKINKINDRKIKQLEVPITPDFFVCTKSIKCYILILTILIILLKLDQL